MKIKVGIDATYTPSGGAKTQLINMLKFFFIDEDIELFIYSKKQNKWLLESYNHDEITVKYSWLSSKSTFMRVIWGQLFLPFYISKDNIDVLFCPGNISPLICSSKKIQWIGTIGPFWDPIYSFPLGIKQKLVFYFNKHFILKSAQSADYVVFESEYTQNFFIEKYNIQANKSSVINIGKDNFFLKDLNFKGSSFNNLSPFILCVSHLYPYKQIPEMIEAFCSINRDNDFKYTLMIAGSKTSETYYQKILTTIDKNDAKESVKLLGSLSKEDLYLLYSKCELMLFPSPCENFAYTLVEAMSRGAPIACSNTTAMPETCGNAAVYFDPFDIDDMKKSISLVLGDKNLENKLRENSLKRVLELPSYEEVTTRTISIMKRIVNE